MEGWRHSVDPGELIGEHEVEGALTALTARCVELTGADGAGALVRAGRSGLRVGAATSDGVELLESFQIEHDEGPGLDCFRSGEVLRANFIGESGWPRFADESMRHGFSSMCAIPIGLDVVTVGSLDLFMSEPVRLSDADVALARALADVTSIAVTPRGPPPPAVHEDELHAALQRRVVVEQAVGMIAEDAHVDVDEALRSLRAYARHHDRKLNDVAARIVARTLAIHAHEGGWPTWPSHEGR
jgi:ANTAR domain/GAF domain